MNTEEKQEVIADVMNALRSGGFAAECIPPAIEHKDQLVTLIANRFWRCNELSRTDAIAYAEIAVNIARHNAHLISLGN
jgi:hypothetical protein